MNRANHKQRSSGLLLVRPDNVTPATRTPWGGHRIFRELKAGLPGIPATKEQPVVGESWEISDDPAFPSQLQSGPNSGMDVSLSELLRADAVPILGDAVARENSGHLPVLVKLIDADDDLSVQVHPPRGHSVLARGESGKDEAWLVLDRTPGAGLYIGFRDHVSPDEVARAVTTGADLSPMLEFVPVEPGDVYEVPAGTVHAAGKGCLLLEIQRFTPPATGITYRLWDWNRRYDEQGRRDPRGTSRPLHVAQSLAVLDFGARAAALRREPHLLRQEEAAKEELIVQDLVGLRLSRITLEDGGNLSVPTHGVFLGLTCTRGRVEAKVAGRHTAFRMGESAIVPAHAQSVQLTSTTDAEIYVVTIRP